MPAILGRSEEAGSASPAVRRGERVDATRIVERRKSERYFTTELVFLAFRPHFCKLGKVKDMNRHGLSFEYLAQDSCDQNSCGEVDIFADGTDAYLSRLPYSLIYEVQVTKSERPGRLDVRRCGLEFGKLSEHQARQLIAIVDKRTASRSPTYDSVIEPCEKGEEPRRQSSPEENAG